MSPAAKVAFVDEFAQANKLSSRSAVLRRAIDDLRKSKLSDDYRAAALEWEQSGEEELWDQTSADGLSVAATSG